MISLILVEEDVRYRLKMFNLITSQKDMVILGSGKDNYDAIMLVKKHKPDMVILNTIQDNVDEMNISCILKRYSPATKIVIFNSCVKDNIIQEMAKWTVEDYLLKDSDMNYLVNIIRGIYRGEHYINPRIIARIFQILGEYFQRKAVCQREIAIINNPENSNCTYTENFSRTELEILHYIAKGYTSKDMASSLFLKEGTVRNYISSIMQKTKLKSRTQIVLYAQEYGFQERNKIPNVFRKSE